MKNHNKVRYITGMAVLTALAIALQLFSNYVKFGTVEISLGLIAIIIGACIYGPLAGMFLGFVVGAIICVSPATMNFFMPVSIPITIAVCLLKTGMAGLISGLVFKLFKKKNTMVGSVLASVIVPIINTGIFIAAALLFYIAAVWGSVKVMLTVILSINFVIEIVVVTILSPTIYKLIEIYQKKYENK